MNQLAHRKRKASSQSVVPSIAYDNNGEKTLDDDDDEPERQSHRKYQKRLQKNRDSAFVSRIRRREYTRLLESSLASLEKEKDSAVIAFRDMKRQFDIVSAELAGIKAGFGVTTANPIGPAPQGAGLSAMPSGGQTGARDQLEGNRVDPPVANRQRAFATTMYMVALVVGVILPDVARNSTFTTRFYSGGNSSKRAAGASDVTPKSGDSFEQHGHVWNALRTSRKDRTVDGKFVDGPSYDLKADLSKGGGRRLVEEVAEEARTILGKERGETIIELLTSHLEQLSVDQVAEVRRVVEEDKSHEGFEAVLRAFVQEEGGGIIPRDIHGETDLDDIVANLIGLDIDDDRLL